MALNIDLSDVQFLTGNGVPAMAADKGSIYINMTASAANTRMYINTNGSTGWAAVTSA